MTTRTLITFILLTIATSMMIGQTSDLRNMSSGPMVYGASIPDGDDVWGYFFVFDEGKDNSYKHGYKCILLDNNLKPVQSFNYLQPRSDEIFPQVVDVEKHGDSLVIKTDHKFFNKKTYSFYRQFTSLRVIDINKSLVGDEYVLVNGAFSKYELAPSQYNTMFRNQKSKEQFSIFDHQSSFGVVRTSYGVKPKSKKQAQRVTFFDNNLDSIWTYVYNNNEAKNTHARIDKLLDTKNGVLLVIQEHAMNDSKQIFNYRLEYIDKLTGKKLWLHDMDKASRYAHNFNVYEYDDNIIVIGTYAMHSVDLRNSNTNKLGFFRMSFDESGNQLLDAKSPWSDAQSFVEIKSNGKIDKKYYVTPVSYRLMRKGESIIIAEKSKSSHMATMNGPRKKTTDLMLFYYDSDFNLTNVETIKKEKSKGWYSDYLFSQYIKDRNGIVFFYQDYIAPITGDKGKWILGINTIINGKRTTEEIEMTSFDHAVYPIKAKEGYTLFREFNRDAKYNMLRLEKLNF